MLRKRQPDSIDQIVARENEARRARESRETQRRLDLSKELGDKAMEGEAFGITGFLAIAFPRLTPESAQYREIVQACHGVRHIQSGKIVQVDRDMLGVLGVKGRGGDKGLQYSVEPWADGSYYGQAEVICARAIYQHNLASSAVIHGSEAEPYGVSFIDSSISATIKPVTVVTPAYLTHSGEFDTYPDGSPAMTERYTARLLEAIEASKYAAV